jgi:uncharacterized protein YbdZ (MbtH family)
MKTCLFWVKEKWSEKIIPVFDVVENNGVWFLIYDNDKFKYTITENYSPVANEWREACFNGAE